MTMQTNLGRRVITFLLAVLTVLSMVGIMTPHADAASYTWSSLGISSSKTMKCYLSGTSNQTTYTTDTLAKKSGSVYVSDEIIVLQIGKNSAGTWVAKIKYPISGGTKTAYIALNKLSSVTSGSFISKTTATAKISPVYRRAGTTTYSSTSYISSGDTVYIVARSGSYTQVVYPISGGWKMAWIKTSTASSYLKVPSSSIDPTGISLNKSSCTLNGSSASVTLTATVTPSNATNKNVTWTTNNSSVATVSGGKVTAVGNGTATITAKDAKGHSASCTVKVSGISSSAGANAIYNIACSQLGKKYGSYESLGFHWRAWCADFVSYCAKQAGQSSVIPWNASVKSMRSAIKGTEYSKSTIQKGGYTPVKGDIIIFLSNGSSHVGIVSCAKNGVIYYIDGNNVSNGNGYNSCVHYSSCSYSYAGLTCVIHPNYR